MKRHPSINKLGSTTEDRPRRIAQIKMEIERAEEGLNMARKKFFEQAIDIEDLDAAKRIYQPEISKLQQELTRLNTEDSTLDQQVETFLQIVTRLPNFYNEADLILKRQIVGLIYPEKAVVKEHAIQTIRPNRAIELICRPSKGSSDPKNKTASENGGCSNVVIRIGFKPMTYCLAYPYGFRRLSTWEQFVVWTISSPLQVYHV